jgi:hypothetical protein
VFQKVAIQRCHHRAHCGVAETEYVALFPEVIAYMARNSKTMLAEFARARMLMTIFSELRSK